MASTTVTAEFSARKCFPAQFKISAEQRLLDFCTNEIGTPLFESSGNCTAAVIGNPLRLVPLDGGVNGGTNKHFNWTGSATAMELNCTGRYLALASGPTISIFDLQKGAILREFHDHDGPVTGLAWHRTSPWLLASVGADCTLRLWDLRSHPAQIALRRTTRPYKALEYSPDCNYIACAGQLVSNFDLNIAQSVVHMACCSPANCVRFNPAECLLATSSEDRVVRFWDVDTGECVTQSPAFDSPIGHLQFAPDGRFLVVQSGKQISCIRWEPFELLVQLAYPLPMQIPAQSLVASNPPISGQNGPQITLLDMRIHGDRLHQLAVVCADATKMGTICSATIQLEQLEKCGIITETVAILPTELNTSNTSIPTCPSSFQIDGEKGHQPEEFTRDEDDISPESVATSTTADSMLDSLTLHSGGQTMDSSGPDEPMKTKSPFTLPSPLNRKRPPPAGGAIKRGTSSMDIGGSIPAGTPPSHSQPGISFMGGGSASKIQQKRRNQQPQELGTFSASGGSRRPNKLTINQPGSSSSSTASSNNNSADSNSSETNRKSLIRRGSSLNDVTDPITTTTANNTTTSTNPNMPISSAAIKSRSKSQAQQKADRRLTISKFSSSAASSSSSASSNSNTTSSSSLGSFPPAHRQRQHSSTVVAKLEPMEADNDSEEEDLGEFMQFDPKLRANIQKQKREIQTLLLNATSTRGNISEFIADQAVHSEEPHVFAQLLQDYMRKPRAYTMALNATFLARTHVLLTHRNEKYVQLALNFLDMVTTRFGDSIRHGLASQEYTIGVDVAAEQRFDRCNKCKNALFQIRLNNAFNTDRMDSAQRRRFEKEILPRIDAIIAQTIKSSPACNRANQSSIN